MARNQAIITVTKADWVQLTNADATQISFQLLSPEEAPSGIYVLVTDDATKPTAAVGWRYEGETDLDFNRTTLSYRAGAGAPKRVWAKAITRDLDVIYSDNSL
jgi:hypothetical protein